MSATSRYDGERRGRLAGVLSLARWGALRSLGARRGWKAKAVPITLALLAVAPAVIVLGVRALFAEQTGIDLTDALPFADYQAIIGIVILLFAAVTTPELLCPDRRDGTLALYFSTAVSRREYLAGRVLGAGRAAAAGDPGAAAGALRRHPGVRGPPGRLPPGPLGRAAAHRRGRAASWRSTTALVGLAVASLTGRRAFAIGGYLLLLVALDGRSAGLLSRGVPRHGRLPAARSSRCCRSTSPPTSSPTPTGSTLPPAPGRSPTSVVVGRGGDRPAAPLPAGGRRVTRRAGLRRRLPLVRRHRRAGGRLVHGRPRRHRPARPQRRGQVDRPEALRGLHPAQHRDRAGAGDRPGREPRGLPAHRHRPRPRRAVAVPDRARDGGALRPPARGGRPRRGRRPGPRRGGPRGRGRPEAEGLLPRDAPAREARPGPGPRAGAAAAGRAPQRPRPRPAARRWWS